MKPIEPDSLVLDSELRSEEQVAFDNAFMEKALALAEQAAESDEVPVGAIVVCDGVVIGEGANAPITQCDPTAHAEVIAIRQASLHQQNYRLGGATLYVTIEPCAMCLGAIVQSRVERVVFGAKEPRSGVLVSNTGLLKDDCFNHHFTVSSGVLSERCSSVISHFFKRRRKLKAQLKAQAQAND